MDEHLKAAKSFSDNMQKNRFKTPSFHVVLGSVLGTALEVTEGWSDLGEISFSEIEGLLDSTVPGHPGKYKFLSHKKTGKVAVFQMGRLHGYEGLTPKKVVLPVVASKLAGTLKFLLTNAAGSLRLDMGEGSAMVINDHVNLTGQNPLVGKNSLDKNGQILGERFPDMANAYDRELSMHLYESLKAHLPTHRGIYLGLLGPNYETPAEVRLFAQWGMDAVGMSTVWEAIALCHLGAKVIGTSLMTNMACGMIPDQQIDHHQILKVADAAARKVCHGILDFLDREFS